MRSACATLAQLGGHLFAQRTQQTPWAEAHAFDVVSVERHSLTDEHEIASQDARAWGDLALRADRGKAEAIALFGCGIRTAGMLPGLESTVGKPAVPATAALALAGLAMLIRRRK